MPESGWPEVALPEAVLPEPGAAVGRPLFAMLFVLLPTSVICRHARAYEIHSCSFQSSHRSQARTIAAFSGHAGLPRRQSAAKRARQFCRISGRRGSANARADSGASGRSAGLGFVDCHGPADVARFATFALGSGSREILCCAPEVRRFPGFERIAPVSDRETVS